MNGDRATTVLLVEDTPEHAALVEEALADEASGGRFQLVVAARLDAALAHLRDGGIGVVLLDLVLPDSEGLETFRRVRAEASELPIVIVSALKDEALALAAMREGAQDYLVKGHLFVELLPRALQYAVARQTAELVRAELLRERTGRAEAEAALERARLADQERLRQARELQTLARLAGAAPAMLTAQSLGVEPLSASVPRSFEDLVARYAGLLDLALEERTYRVDHPISDGLRALADELGFLRAGPRDVVELHTTALTARMAAVSRQRAQAYLDEGRVMALELMGYLAGYYRG